MTALSDPLTDKAMSKFAPVAEGFKPYLYELVGTPPNTMIKVTGCVFRAAKRGPRKGELVVPVKGTQRECFV